MSHRIDPIGLKSGNESAGIPHHWRYRAATHDPSRAGILAQLLSAAPKQILFNLDFDLS